MTEQAAVQQTSSAGSIFALVSSTPPVWKKIIKIDGNGSEVVSDYKISPASMDALALAIGQDKADSDDTPEQQQLLMSAWQALATYLGGCDDEDKAGAMQALKLVSALMAGPEVNGPDPQGTFGVTIQAAAAVFECPTDKRTFTTEAGLLAHLKSMHGKGGV